MFVRLLIRVFFLNNSFSPNLKKLLNLKLLNFLQKYKTTSKMLVTQTNTLDTQLISKIKKNYLNFKCIDYPEQSRYKNKFVMYSVDKFVFKKIH